MKKIIYKLFWAWDYEKEEKWLNEMAAKGLCLSSVSFCRYEFESCTPGEYSFRLELLENLPNHPESQKYIEFLEETGVKHVGTYMRWVYFRKNTSDGQFDIYSDINSRLLHLKRLITLLTIVSSANLLIGIYNIFCYFYFQSHANLCGIVNIILSLIIFMGIGKLITRKKKLKKEQQIYES